MRVLRINRRMSLAAVLAAGMFVAACGAAPGAPMVAVTSTRVATVGSGAECIPDLNTTHINLVALHRAGGTGVFPSGSSAQQVREGAVPAPPLARLLARGQIGDSQNGGGSASPLGAPQIVLYRTSCAPGDVQAYYVAVLTENQWTGEFVPASGAATVPAQMAVAAGASGAGVTLFDLTSLATGRFVNMHPRGDTAAFIDVVAAIRAPGTTGEQHPTYVQIVVQPSRGDHQVPILPPTMATTPDVGASAAPPGGDNAP